ncbi:MAG: hypothetical protein M3Q75_07550 [Gemmatimonadota bacterium]|nr:hypothetical protein [Gemmatimonadota bacterium]
MSRDSRSGPWCARWAWCDTFRIRNSAGALRSPHPRAEAVFRRVGGAEAGEAIGEGDAFGDRDFVDKLAVAGHLKGEGGVWDQVTDVGDLDFDRDRFERRAFNIDGDALERDEGGGSGWSR